MKLQDHLLITNTFDGSGKVVDNKDMEIGSPHLQIYIIEQMQVGQQIQFVQDLKDLMLK